MELYRYVQEGLMILKALVDRDDSLVHPDHIQITGSLRYGFIYWVTAVVDDGSPLDSFNVLYLRQWYIQIIYVVPEFLL